MSKKQTVWITGASSGIGAALAQVFAAQGATVILTARRLDQLEAVRAKLSNPDQHHCIALDITDFEQVDQTVKAVFAKFSTVDVLINNAGLSQRALIADTSMDTERKIMEVDYFAQVNLSKQVLPYFVQQKSGQLAFVSSVAGLLGTQYRASYSAAKAAIHMWANSCRAEYAEQGINVSVIFPGFVQTDVAKNALNGAGQPQGYEDEATENGLSAEDFARQVVQALTAKQEYIVVGGSKEKLGVLVSRLSPKLLYKMIRKTQVK
ncbi:SDR family NAD(P)-dependent oxidoreductase [Acinetobacter puyangensis]|uniref:Short-chain dehydrogenase n=1 Tax=Acinetobacter puyangensis TaxID=1096779 RepID=A0A240E6W6_9GAMM|nr:SDR family oxidoreductase [Acinetobacter puyangensis]SNX43620.1 Short-chain dehydrogenase [Acinetobacter puyangensis]